MSIIIDDELCTGCASCVANCPFGGVEIIDDVAVITGKCTLCGACVDVCPMEAITLEREEYIDKVDKTRFKGVWVIAEHYKGVIQKVAYQLLGKGRDLANKLNVNLVLVLLGDKFDDILKDFAEYGADEVIYIKSSFLKNYYSDF
jgi:electron transfer flavoprotein alpha subunit